VQRKQQLAGNDLVEDDLAAQAYVENFATKVFNNGSRAIETRAATKYAL
jgi:vacuolar protein sorting-associated protein VTA1